MKSRLLFKKITLHCLAIFGYLLGFPLFHRIFNKNRKVKILLYHNTAASNAGEMNVIPPLLIEQLDWLIKHCEIVSLDRAVAFIKNRTYPLKSTVAVTFDDGYKSNHETAFPLLKIRQIEASIFLLTMQKGQARQITHLNPDLGYESELLNWDEAREMTTSCITFGSHGVTHNRLKELPDDQLKHEIVSSKDKIESELKKPVRFFSYPYGTLEDFDERAKRFAREAGYEAAFTANFGSNGPDSDLFALQRIGIDASDTMFTFKAKLNGALGFLGILNIRWVRRCVRFVNSLFHPHPSPLPSRERGENSCHSEESATRNLDFSGAEKARSLTFVRDDRGSLRDDKKDVRHDKAKEAALLLVSVDFPPHTNGVATISRELSVRLSSEGKNVMVVGPKDQGDVEFDKGKDYQIYRLPGYYWGYFRILPYLFVLPYIIFSKKVKHVLPMNIAYGGLITWFLSFLKPLDYLIFAYGYEFEKVKGTFLQSLYHFVYQRAKKIITCSQSVKDRLTAFGVPETKIEVLYPAVDLDRYRPISVPTDYVKKMGFENKRLLLSVGRLVDRKGHDKVIEVLPKILKQFPDVVYCISGIGQHETELRNRVKASNLEGHVRFLGRVSEEEILFLYNLCEVFVMPSREIETSGQIEGFGIVFLEANACAKPVIGGKSGGVLEAIRDQETGFLVDPNSSEEIAEKIIYLLTNPEKSQAMGRRGLQWVQENFSWEKYVERVLKALQ